MPKYVRRTICPPEASVFFGEEFWVPFDPRDRLGKSLLKPFRSVRPPRIVIGTRIAEVILDKFEELDWLAPHLRDTRRSSSASVIRFAAPDLYAAHRLSSSFFCPELTGNESVIPDSQSSSANSNRWRLGSFFSSGKLASVTRKTKRASDVVNERYGASGLLFQLERERRQRR